MAFCLHLSTISYIKDGIPQFKDITNADNLALNLGVVLDCQPEQEKEKVNNGIPVIDFEKKARKKKN